MPNSTQASGDGEERSANDEFMDQFADPDDDDYEDDRPSRSAPGLLPGALIGAGIASLCAIGIYLLAGGGGDNAGPSPQTVTFTQDGPTRTVTAGDSSGDPANDSTFTRTSTVTLPQQTRTVRVVQNGPDKTVTRTVTKDGAAKTKTETKTTTASAPPPKTETTTVTETTTRTIGPPRRTVGDGQ